MTSPRPTAVRRALTLALVVVCCTVSWLVPAHANLPKGWTEQPTASSKADTQACADYAFIGVRGSGEQAPYGPTVTRVRNQLAQQWAKGTVRQLWLEYPAGDPHTLSDVPLHRLIFERPMPSTVYFDSADLGGRQLATLLLAQQQRCPDERVILAGFSQGAQVITRALALTDGRSSRVVAAILIGNPSHYPGQNVRELSGNAPLNATGLGAFLYVLRDQARIGDQTSREEAVRNLIKVTIAMAEGDLPTATIRSAMVGAQAEIPPTNYARTYSVCRAGDMVCDAGPAMAQIMVQNSSMSAEITRTRPIHGNYDDAVLKPTVDEVRSYLNSLPLITASPAPSTSAHPLPQPTSTSSHGAPVWLLAGAAVAVVAALAIGYLTGRRHRRPQH